MAEWYHGTTLYKNHHAVHHFRLSSPPLPPPPLYSISLSTTMSYVKLFFSLPSSVQVVSLLAASASLYVLHKWWDNYTRLKNIPSPVSYIFSVVIYDILLCISPL
jgi:hypothetical protein